MKKIMAKEKWVLIIVLLTVAFLGCSNISVDNVKIDKTNDVPIEFVEFDYMNQTLPTGTAIHFQLKGANVAWFWDGTPTFSPDGKQMYWSKIFSSWDEPEIWYITKMNGAWTIGKKLIVEGIDGFTSCPIFAGNSYELYFKNRTSQGEISIVKVTKVNDIWTNPETLDIPLSNEYSMDGRFSIAGNKNIYFTALSKSGMEHMKIFCSEYRNGEYQTPTAIDVLNGDDFGSASPYIAKDESYILYDSGPASSVGVQDIYVSFKNDLGDFLEPIHLGDQVNSTEEENSVTISADGKYLFFCSRREGDVFYTPYWIQLDKLSAFIHRQHLEEQFLANEMRMKKRIGLLAIFYGKSGNGSEKALAVMRLFAY